MILVQRAVDQKARADLVAMCACKLWKTLVQTMYQPGSKLSWRLGSRPD